MTDKTATERRLLDSIRQAKTGEEPQGAAAAPANTARPARTTKATPKRTSTTARTSRARKTTTKRSHPGTIAAYQSPGRVWPD